MWARRYRVGRQWVHELLARYAAEGDAGLEPRSRRSRTNPQATGVAIQARILALRAELTKKGRDAGAETIAAHLEREGPRFHHRSCPRHQPKKQNTPGP
ncbi:MAG TPA: helix-turn-helix domain-containing protein [Arthrobacter sp.]|nr:helix-turn-helix domain-containing protein [Arthrobacter sp.]